MTLSFSIRPARLADAATLETLFEVLDEHHRCARPHVFRKPPDARREVTRLAETIQGPDSIILLAVGVDGNILGLAVLATRSVAAIPVRAARQFVEIVELIVAAEARHLGVGRSLVDAAQSWARDHDIPALEVSAWSFNREATDFYKRIGFEPTVERFALAVPRIQGKYREKIEK